MTDNHQPENASDAEKETHKLERIAIPPECREVKAWFWERPTPEIVSEIKRHVDETGLPYTWRGHTHTKPLAGSKPVYLEEFDLPEKCLKAKRWAPCPCCWPETPKYGHNGKIAWFASEGVIRLLGPDCFKNLDKEGHEEAKRQLEIERRRKQDTDYLLSKLPLLGKVISVGEGALPVARALDAFRGDLLSKLAIERLPLWDHVRRDGTLKIRELSQEFRQNADGSMRIVEVEKDRVYARLPGYEILNPGRTPSVAKLQGALRKLREYDYGEDWPAKLGVMDDQEKMKAAQSIGSAVESIKSSLAKLHKLRAFTEKVSVNTLRAWGSHEGCPMPRVFVHYPDRIMFGRSEHQNVSVTIPPDLGARIGAVEF